MPRDITRTAAARIAKRMKHTESDDEMPQRLGNPRAKVKANKTPAVVEKKRKQEPALTTVTEENEQERKRQSRDEHISLASYETSDIDNDIDHTAEDDDEALRSTLQYLKSKKRAGRGAAAETADSDDDEPTVTSSATVTSETSTRRGKVPHPARSGAGSLKKQTAAQRLASVAAKLASDAYVSDEQISDDSLYSDLDSNSSGTEDGTLPKEQLRKLQKLANTTTQAIEAERSNKRQKVEETQYRPGFEPTTEEYGVVYLGGVPHGFFEHQMRHFFTQFGDVTRLRLARNPKTGKSRHYAFIEFDSSDVARIVASNFNGYMMFGKTLQCHFLPATKVHPNTFIGAVRETDKVKSASAYRQELAARRSVFEKIRSSDEQQRRERNLKKAEKKRLAQLAKFGVSTYEFEGYNNAPATMPTTTIAEEPAVESTTPPAGQSVAPAAAAEVESEDVSPVKATPTPPRNKLRSTVKAKQTAQKLAKVEAVPMDSLKTRSTRKPKAALAA